MFLRSRSFSSPLRQGIANNPRFQESLTRMYTEIPLHMPGLRERLPKNPADRVKFFLADNKDQASVQGLINLANFIDTNFGKDYSQGLAGRGGGTVGDASAPYAGALALITPERIAEQERTLAEGQQQYSQQLSHLGDLAPSEAALLQAYKAENMDKNLFARYPLALEQALESIIQGRTSAVMNPGSAIDPFDAVTGAGSLTRRIAASQQGRPEGQRRPTGVLTSFLYYDMTKWLNSPEGIDLLAPNIAKLALLLPVIQAVQEVYGEQVFIGSHSMAMTAVSAASLVHDRNLVEELTLVHMNGATNPDFFNAFVIPARENGNGAHIFVNTTDWLGGAARQGVGLDGLLNLPTDILVRGIGHGTDPILEEVFREYKEGDNSWNALSVKYREAQQRIEHITSVFPTSDGDAEIEVTFGPLPFKDQQATGGTADTGGSDVPLPFKDQQATGGTADTSAFDPFAAQRDAQNPDDQAAIEGESGSNIPTNEGLANPEPVSSTVNNPAEPDGFSDNKTDEERSRESLEEKPR
jgi:hypothetical protein